MPYPCVSSAACFFCLKGSGLAGTGHKCSQFLLQEEGWQKVCEDMIMGDQNYFAPGNLRAAADNSVYKSLIDGYIANRWTLRYSGGLVPDVHLLLIKVRP